MLIIQRITDLSQLQGVPDGRVLVSEDVLVRVTRTGLALSYMQRPSPVWRNYPPAEDALPQRLFADPMTAVFTAYEDSVFIGLAAVRLEPAGWGRLLDLRVDAIYRRRGVATQLLAACREFAVHHGMGGLRAMVRDDDPVMCQFLEHMGYQLGGMDRMALALTPPERTKPLAQRACQLIFYETNRKG